MRPNSFHIRDLAAWKSVFLATLLMLCSTQAQSHSCIRTDQRVAYALCEDGRCTAGFEVLQELSSVQCAYLSVVRELTPADLDTFAAGLGQSAPGTFKAEVGFGCGSDGWAGTSCLMSITRLSEGLEPQLLKDYRRRWMKRQREDFRVHFLDVVTRFGFPPLVTILVMGWPWALYGLVPRFRRHVGWSLCLAVPVQLLVAFWFSLALWIGVGPQLLLWLPLVCAVIILVGIPIQIGYFIRRRISGRAEPA